MRATPDAGLRRHRSRGLLEFAAVRWTAIVNPAAGRGRTQRLLPRLADACGRIGARVVVSTSPADAIAVATEAFARGDGVIACGGDGTVSSFAGPAVAHDGVLAIVPSGSGNDFARDVGLDPRRPLDAIADLPTAPERRVDLGRATATTAAAVPGTERVAPTTRAVPETAWFCSVASTGFDAATNRLANQIDFLRGTPLYVAAMLRTLASYAPRRFAITIDDGPVIEHEAWLVAFANTRSYGGGMRIAPDAQLDDGLLDLTIVGPVGRGELLRTFPRVFRGTHTTHPLVTTARARTATIAEVPTSAGPPDSELYASGEEVGPLPARIEVVPSALRLRAPGRRA